MRQLKFDKPAVLIRDLFRYICKDYHWKLNLELAHSFDRQDSYAKSQHFLRNALLEAPDCIRWKLWLVSARMLLSQQMVEQARLSIERACMEVPLKQISTALLEYAKFYETIGDNAKALAIINRVREQSNVEWKVQFEAVVMYMRMGMFEQAETIVREALDLYSAKGRLWALLIQIQHQRAETAADY